MLMMTIAANSHNNRLTESSVVQYLVTFMVANLAAPHIHPAVQRTACSKWTPARLTVTTESIHCTLI